MQVGTGKFENKINFGHKILVAEDDTLTRRLIVKFLKNFDTSDTFEIQEATTGQEALKAIHSGDKFDLIMTDGHMGTSQPGLNSFDADGIKVIKAAKEHKCPTILCSGDEALKSIAEGLGSNTIVKDISKFKDTLKPMLMKMLNLAK